MMHKTAWMNLKGILLSEKSQTQKTTYYRFLLHDIQKKSKL